MDVLAKEIVMSTEHKQSLSAVTLAAIGVVYGDGNPLYALRECFSGHYGFDVRPDVVFGFLSLIFWMLILIVSIKYLTYVMRADNAGEGHFNVNVFSWAPYLFQSHFNTGDSRVNWR